MKTIGIIGAGQMGAGIAHVSALAGYDVRINDIEADAINEGIDGIGANMERQVAKERVTTDAMTKAMARIKAAPALSDLSDCDMVIEAATENEDVKKTIFKSLQPHLKTVRSSRPTPPPFPSRVWPR